MKPTCIEVPRTRKLFEETPHFPHPATTTGSKHCLIRAHEISQHIAPHLVVLVIVEELRIAELRTNVDVHHFLIQEAADVPVVILTDTEMNVRKNRSANHSFRSFCDKYQSARVFRTFRDKKTKHTQGGRTILLVSLVDKSRKGLQ